MWKITLSDGTTIGDLTLSGNNFISKTEVNSAMFTGKMNGVTITPSDENDINGDIFGLAGYHAHMKLDALMKYPDGWHIIMNDIPQSELDKTQNRADLEYVAMMAGVEL